MKKYIVLAFILFLIGCNSEETKENSSNYSENKDFIWDFSTKKTFVYSYSQKVNSSNKMDKNDLKSKSYISANGLLKVRVKDNSMADLSLIDIKSKIVSFDEKGEPKGDTIENTNPANVIQDMKSDGSFSDQNANIMFDILFPLPSTDLKMNESEKIALQMPFNANGSRLISKGYNNLTFKKYETIENRKCAVLEGTIDITKFEIPEELKGDYKNATTGLATYYFDLENHFYVGADIQLLMEMMMNSESEDDDNFGMFMEISSNNLIKVRLKRIEE